MKWKRILTIPYGIFNILRNNYRDRHVTYPTQLVRWFKNRHLQFRIISFEEAREFKKSDTIFILGSGLSIMDITPAQWSFIKKHDTFGINFSFLLDFVPTFHQQEYGHIGWWLKDIFIEVLSKRDSYNKAVWFISSADNKRGLHPRYTPELLPANPICCIYKHPPAIKWESDRPFTKETFQKSIVYRASLSRVLYLVLQMQYKHIVLLGVDLETPAHFYDDMEEMKEFAEKRKEYIVEHNIDKFDSMFYKAEKYHPFDVYLYALNDYILKPKGINLYIGRKDGLLSDKIPCYWSTSPEG
jgi:hypothetical protein